MNKYLDRARKEENDEFYTFREDIKKEIENYKDQFKDKIVYLPTDQPGVSEFWSFFYDNYKEYNLKGLWASYMDEDAVLYKYNGIGIEEVEMSGDGEILSEEVKDIMLGSDIIVTNPPFSIFRDIVDRLVEVDVDFLIMGSVLGVNYKNVFKYIVDDKVRVGYNKVNKFKTLNGGIKEVGVKWYTNLKIDYSKKRKPWKGGPKYKKDNYDVYDNYDAINVDRLVDIPSDYNGEMGVPVTFLHFYEIDKEFDIIGMSGISGELRVVNDKIYKDIYRVSGDNVIKKDEFNLGVDLYMKTKEKPGRGVYYDLNNGYYIYRKFKRVIIKRRVDDEE